MSLNTFSKIYIAFYQGTIDDNDTKKEHLYVFRTIIDNSMFEIHVFSIIYVQNVARLVQNVFKCIKTY